MTELLTALKRGETEAWGHAFELVYDELRGLAHAQRRRFADQPTLGTTALVHEAYLKLAAAGGVGIDGRRHFLGLASRTMRHLLCNHARDRRRLKRGGALRRATADVDDVADHVSHEDLETLVALDDALTRLERLDERLARVVECRFFAGLSIPRTAEALGTSAATVKRDWTLARTWLYREIAGLEEAP
jgi:RNA polymerase sigma factor (TIGR02999 family)